MEKFQWSRGYDVKQIHFGSKQGLWTFSGGKEMAFIESRTIWVIDGESIHATTNWKHPSFTRVRNSLIGTRSSAALHCELAQPDTFDCHEWQHVGCHH